MSSLIKPFFRLMVVTFILAMLMPVATTWAGPDCTSPKHAGNPNCPPPDDPTPPAPSVTYTVGLMGRAFHFTPPADVTPNGKENTLFPNIGETLKFTRPGGGDVCSTLGGTPEVQAACEAWDAVFAACENFFGDTPVPGIGPTPMGVSGFEVPAGNWDIQKPGGVRLGMIIPFDNMGVYSPPGDDGTHFSVWLQLIGHNSFDGPDAPWLPEPGSSIDYGIVDFWITGGTVKGVHPKKGCVSGGSAEIVDFDPGQPRALTIEAVEVP